jgi:hypothetical protein
VRGLAANIFWRKNLRHSPLSAHYSMYSFATIAAARADAPSAPLTPIACLVKPLPPLHANQHLTGACLFWLPCLQLQGQLSQLRATLESQGVVLDQGSGQFVTQRPVSQQLPRQHHAATSQHLSRHRPHTEPLYGTDVHGNPSSSSWQGMGPEASAGSAVFQGAAALQQQGPGQGQGQGQAPGRPHSGSMLSGEGAMMQVPMHPSSSMRPHRMDMPLYDMDAWAPGPGPGVVLPRSQYLAMQQQAPGHVPPGGAHMPQPRFMSGPLTVAMQQQQQQQQQHPAHWGHGMQQHQAPRTVRRPVSGDISASGGYVMAPGPGPSESYPGVLLPEQSQYYYAAQQPGCAGGPYAHPAPHAPPLAPTAPPRRPHTITFPHNIRQQQQGAGGGYVMAPDGGMTGMGGQDMQMHAPAGMEAGAGMPQQQQQQQFMFAQHQEMMVKQEMRAMSGATGAESAGMMPLRQQQQPQLGNLVAIPQGHMSQPGVPAQAAVTAPPPPHPAASAQAGGTPPAAAAAHLGPGAVNSPSQTFSSDIDDGYGLGEAWELLPPTLPAPPGFPGAGPAYRGPGDPYNATSHPSAGYPPISLPPRGYQSAAAAGGVLGPRDLQVPHAQHFHSGAIASHKQTVTTPPAPGTGADSPVQVLGQVPYTREQIPGSGAQQGQQPVRPYSAPVFGSDAATFARPPDHIVGLVPGAPNLGPGPGSVTGGAPGYTSQGSHQGVGAFSFSPPGLQTLGRVSSLQEIWEDMEMTQPLQGSDAFLGGPPLGGDQPGAVTPAAAAAAGGADGRLQAAAAQAQQLQTAQVTAGGTSAAAAGPDTAQQSLDMNMLRIGSMGSQA